MLTNYVRLCTGGAVVCVLAGGLFGQVPRITRYVDDSRRIVLRGHRHPLARAEYDRGEAPPATRLERMILTLQPDARQQWELETLLAAQQDPASPEYHGWLTPAEFGLRFGPSERDIEQVVEWLKTKGFEVEPVSASRATIVFSGTVAQTASAFHTRIHLYEVEGEMHHANSTGPEIPEALAAVVAGVVSLHDFHAVPLHLMAQPAPDSSPEFTSGSAHYLAPADFATIYNLRPLYSASIDARGQSIAVAGRSNIKAADVQSFRSTFGLPAGAPLVIVNGADPGIVAGNEQSEAQLDVEWAGAVAANAQVQFVASASTKSTDGVALSAQYIVDHNLAPIVSLSFGNCEAAMGAAGNQFWNALWQRAAAQGMTVLVASGDSGAAGCDSASSASASGGRGVNGLCSSPYATCVGGTQFNDTANPAVYWAAANTATYNSAIGYIPELAWNSSGTAGGSGLWASGGGASALYLKPSWQAGAGVPSDNHRYVPDISLNGAVHDGYLFVVNGQVYAAGGTSVSTPAFAGLMALALQKQGANFGNANSVLYNLAALQAKGGAVVFHDVTTGNNSVPGVTGYSAGAGYDAVTGLGSVDATQLVNHWNDGAAPVPKCTYSLAKTTQPATAAAASYSVAIATATGCKWTAASTANWIAISSGASGTGSGTVAYSAAANSVTSPRTGSLTIAGLVFTVTQDAAAAPVFSLSPLSASFSAAGGAGSTVLTAPSSAASWTAVSKVTWISVTNGGSGTGNKTITYSVAANTTTSARTGTLTIAGLTLTVTQAALACSYTVSLGPVTSATSGYSGSVAVTAAQGCSWTATSSVTWITIGSGASGSGNGTVRYLAVPNTTRTTRTGTLTVAGYAIQFSEGPQSSPRFTGIRVDPR